MTHDRTQTTHDARGRPVLMRAPGRKESHVTKLRAVWPINDPDAPVSHLRHLARRDLPSIASQNGVRLVGDPTITVRRGEDVPGWSGYDTVLVADTDYEPDPEAPSGDPYVGAICRQIDADLWYSFDPAEIAQAKAWCKRCPALEACRERGLPEKYGVWGGMTVEERVNARRRAARKQKAS